MFKDYFAVHPGYAVIFVFTAIALWFIPAGLLAGEDNSDGLRWLAYGIGLAVFLFGFWASGVSLI